MIELYSQIKHNTAFSTLSQTKSNKNIKKNQKLFSQQSCMQVWSSSLKNSFSLSFMLMICLLNSCQEFLECPVFQLHQASQDSMGFLENGKIQKNLTVHSILILCQKLHNLKRSLKLQHINWDGMKLIHWFLLLYIDNFSNICQSICGPGVSQCCWYFKTLLY